MHGARSALLIHSVACRICVKHLCVCVCVCVCECVRSEEHTSERQSHLYLVCSFLFNSMSTTEISTLSQHYALSISFLIYSVAYRICVKHICVCVCVCVCECV